MSRYDGHLPGNWADCVWQPKAIRNLVTIKKIVALNDLAQALTDQRASVNDFSTHRGKPITAEQRKQLYDRGYR